MNVKLSCTVLALLCIPFLLIASKSDQEDVWKVDYKMSMVEKRKHLDGTKEVSNDEVLAKFQNVAKKQTLVKQDLKISYYKDSANIFQLTLPVMSMTTYNRNSSAVEYKTRATGIGDLELAYQRLCLQEACGNLWCGLGLNLPSGSVNYRDDTPGVDNQLLTYDMQLGSGTWGARPFIQLQKSQGKYVYGLFVEGLFRTGKNDRDYRLGNTYMAALSLSRAFTSQWLGTLTLYGNKTGSIHGKDPDLNEDIDPRNRADSSQLTQAGLLFRIDYLRENSPRGWKFFMEVAGPAYQKAKALQPRGRSQVSLGLQCDF